MSESGGDLRREWEEFLEFRRWREAHSQAGASGAEPPRDPTVWELYAPYAEFSAPRIKHWKSTRAVHWKHLLPYWGQYRVSELDYTLADGYQRMRLAEKRLQYDGRGGSKPGNGGVMPGTINAEMISLRALLNWSVQRRLIDRNPLTGHPDLPVTKRRRFSCSEGDFEKILAQCNPTLRLMLTLAYETGMRRDEFRLLEWTEVDLEGEPATIGLPPHRTKGGKGRVIPLGSRATEVLRAAPRLPGCRYVFPSPTRTDGQPIPFSTLGYQFRAARKRAGVHGPGNEEIWIHTLRKSHGVNMVLEGMPVYMLMERLGHTTLSSHEEYTALSPAHHRAAAAFLERPKTSGKK